MRFLLLLPILTAFAFLEIFIGGARLLYAVPGAMLVALSTLLLIPNKGIKTSQRGDLAAIVSSLLFAGYVLARNRFSEIEYIARLQFFIMAGCLLVYLLFTLVLSRPNDRKWLFFTLLILALLQLIPAIVQFTEGNQWMPFPWAQRQDIGVWRGSGLFISPNNFAGFLEIAALLAISYAIWGRTTVLMRILTGYAALLCIVGVAISGSRGGYLSFVSGTIVIVILSLIAWQRIQKEHFLFAALSAVGATVALFGGILLVFLLSPTIAQRVLQINDPNNMRLLLWHSALQQFDLSPVWGTGGFSFLYYGRLFRDPSVQHDPIHTHNDYLQLLADYGLVGMGLFLLFLFAHLRSGGAAFFRLSSPSSQSADLKSDRLALNIGALASVAAYMVHSVVDFNMQLPLNALMMASLFAILANPGAPVEDSKAVYPFAKFRTLLRFALPLFGIAVIVYGIPMIHGEFCAYQARAALNAGNPQLALDWSRKGTLQTQKNPELYFYRGEAALELAEQKAAKQQGKPSAEIATLRVESINSFASGLKIFPFDSRLALKLAQAQASAGNYYPAIQSVDYAEKLDPNSAFVPAYRGLIEYAFKNYEDATLAFEKAIELGGQGGDIAKQGLELVEKQQSLEDEPAEITTEDSSTTSPTDASAENKSVPSPDTPDTGTDLLHALPEKQKPH